MIFWNWLVLHVADKPDFTTFLFSGMLCWVLPFNDVYHKRVLYFFEDLLLYENITLGLDIKLWKYYSNIRNLDTCQVIIIICRNYMNITVSVTWTANTISDGSSSVGSQAEGMGDTVNWHHKPTYLCLRNVSRLNMHLKASAKC